MLSGSRVDRRLRGAPNYWQRRYALKHYKAFGNATLAQATGLREEDVAAFLSARGATRSAGDLRRIAQSRDESPTMFTPRFARQRLTRLDSRPLVALDWLLIVGLVLGSLIAYGATAARTVTGEDGGELLAAVHGLGVPHPPGYPLWLLLSWVADHGLPFGTVAFRVTVTSFLFSALANGLFLAIALKTIRSRLAALVGALLFSVSLTHWTQAVIPEVYALNIFFVALCGLLLVRLGERPTKARLLWLAFIAGLACTNHTTAVPIAGVLFVGAILIAPQLFKRPTTVVLVLLAGLLPNALYFILPLISLRQPYIDWGNPESLQALWEHMSRRQYSGMETEHRAAETYADYLHRLGNLRDWSLRQFGNPWVLLLSALGFLPLCFRQTGVWLFLSLSAYLCTVGVTRYMAYDFGREHMYAVTMFWIPAAMTLAWYAAGGLDVLLAGLHALLRKTQPVVQLGASAAAALLLLGFVALPTAKNAYIADRSGTTLVRDFGKAILTVMEPGALYFPSSDHSTFSVLYWQGVEHYRPDVTLADKYGRLEQGVLDQVLDESDIRRANALPGLERRAFIETVLMHKWPGPVYFANRRTMTDVPDRVLEPVGPIFKVMTSEEATAWWAAGKDDAPAPGVRLWDDLRHLVEVPEEQQVDLTVQMVRGDMLYMRGFALLRAGKLDEAIASWSRIEGNLAPLKQTLNNCGSALAEHGRTEQALEFYARALQEDPRYTIALRNQASVYASRQDWSRAISTLQTLIEVAPDGKEARLELAHLLASQDRVVEALAQYEELATRDQNDPTPWIEAGKLLQRVGDRTKAETAFVEALRIDARSEDVAQSLARLRQGVDLLAAEGPGGADHEGLEWGEEPPQWGGPARPELPTDPAAALMFDPMRASSQLRSLPDPLRH